jgi:hypothetical protein
MRRHLPIIIFVTLLAEAVIGAAALFAAPDNLSLLMLMACLVFLCGITLLRPEMGLLLIIFFIISDNLYYKFNVTNRIDISLKIIFPLPFLVFCGWVLQKVARREPFPKLNLLDITLFLLVVWTFASVFWGGDVFYGLFQTWVIFSCFLIYFLITSFIKTEHDFKRVLIFLMIVGLLAAGMSILSFFTGQVNTLFSKEINSPVYVAFWTNVGATQKFQRGGGMAGPNLVAAFINVCILLTLGLFLMEKKGSMRKAYILAIIFMIAGSTYTSSRGGFFGLLLGLLSFGLLAPFLRVKYIRYSVLVCTIMMAFFFISRIGSPNWGMKQLQEVFLSSGGGVPTKSAAGRIDMWKRGLDRGGRHRSDQDLHQVSECTQCLLFHTF